MSEANTWRPLQITIAALAAVMVIYHLISSQYLLLTTIGHKNAHLGLSLLLVFLSAMQKKKRLWHMILLFILFSLAATAYVHIFEDGLQERMGFPTTLDMVVSAIVVLLVLEATRQSFGAVLPLICSISIAYIFLGKYIPGPLHAPSQSFAKIMSSLCIGLEGVYGVVLSVSAFYIFLFIVFGAMLQVTGATRFFTEIGRIVGRRLQSGPAIAAVATSGLLGMVTGSVVANITITGAFTIPLMKRVGYRPEQAAAIEAAASTGGQIMPPIMGAAAFVMASFMGVPYIKIAAAAAIPALFYFFMVALYAQFQAIRLDISPPDEKADYRELWLSAPLFLVPLAILVFLLVRGRTPTFSIFWAFMVAILLSLIRKKTRPSWGQWVEGCVKGAMAGAQIGVMSAAIGLVIITLSATGLGIKLPGLIEAWSGGNLFVALIIAMVATIIIGCGMPTTPVYILVALVAAPALVDMGLNQLQAHFFVFYFACLNFVTPPVAIGSLIASKIASASFFKTAIESVKVALGGFAVPFFIIWCPWLLLQPGSSASAIPAIIAGILGLIALQITLCNCYMSRLDIIQRAISFIAAATLLIYLPVRNHAWFVTGIIFFIVLTFMQLKKKRAQRRLINIR
ncbi:TRAP transporter permease [Thermodesulfobacteriota bacterium]